MGSSGPIPDTRLRERLIATHLPLVRSIARRHLGRGEELDDLVQVGSVGLVKASDRFDPSRGVEFGTFAAPVIEGEIRHHLRDRTRPVRIPRDVERIRAGLRREGAKLAGTLGRTPTAQELAAALGVEEGDIERALTAERSEAAISLSSTADTGDPSAEAETPTSSDDRLLVASSLLSLDERERRLVFLRFHVDMTERQIAREVGISQAHVSRLLNGALAKLRKELATTAVDPAEGDITPETRDRGSGNVRTMNSSSNQPERRTVAQHLELPYHIDVKSEREGERWGWIATVQELPGCGSQGDTAEQAVARLRPAMESWFESAIAENRQIPMPGPDAARSRAAHSYSGRLLVRMPKLLHEQLAHRAEQQQISLNRLVTEVLAEAVEQGDLGKSSTANGSGSEFDRRSADPRASGRSLRLALAANLVVVVLAGIVAMVVLVLALQRGI